MSTDYNLSTIEGIGQAVSAQLLASKGLAVAFEIGAKAASSYDAGPRLVWQPDEAKYEPIVRQPSDGHAVAQRAGRWKVLIIGANYTAAEALELSLATALSFLFGAEWFTYKPIATRPAPERVTGSAYALEHTLELRVPVYDKVWIHAQRPLSGQATGAVTDGTTTENIAS